MKDKEAAREFVEMTDKAFASKTWEEWHQILLENCIACGAINAREGKCVMSAVSDRALAKVDTDIRSVVRADIFKNAMLGLMLDK